VRLLEPCFGREQVRIGLGRPRLHAEQILGGELRESDERRHRATAISARR
jgi:hypothetical protein